jgi:hypothetical protein
MDFLLFLPRGIRRKPEIRQFFNHTQVEILRGILKCTTALAGSQTSRNMVFLRVLVIKMVNTPFTEKIEEFLMKTIVTFLLMFLVAVSGECGASEPDNAQVAKGSDIVLAIYHDYAWQAVMPMYLQDQSLARQSEKVLSKYFVPSLVALIRKDAECVDRTQDECNLGFDPIFASQDPEAVDLQVGDEHEGVVPVRFVYPGDKSNISMDYHVQKTSEGWRIADIVYKGPIFGSLREILSKARSH